MPLPSGMDSTAPYNTTRARPCPSAVSLVVQLWQARQSLQLVRSAERRLRIRHGAILRIRPDIFFFRPVELPRPPPGLASWYSMLEESCHVREGVSEAVYGKASLRFLQDFWLYGSRDVMDVALQEPLERLLGFGRDAAAFMACATCHDRPATITPDGTVGEPCCKRKPRSTPKYALHPVPEALNHHYNESRQCLKYTSPYGLLRVNPGEACFVVQARMPKGKGGRLIKAKEWRQVDVASPAVGSRLRGAGPALPRGGGVRVPPLLRPRLEPQLPADRRRPQAVLGRGGAVPALADGPVRRRRRPSPPPRARVAAVSSARAPGWRRWWGRCTMSRRGRLRLRNATQAFIYGSHNSQSQSRCAHINHQHHRSAVQANINP